MVDHIQSVRIRTLNSTKQNRRIAISDTGTMAKLYKAAGIYANLDFMPWAMIAMLFV